MKPIYSDPMLWGKHVWKTMEIFACTLNYENKHHIFDFLEKLQYLLPCPTCRGHYKEYFQKKSPHRHMKSPIDLLRWIHELQGEIRRRQQREDKNLSFEDYLDSVISSFDVPEVYYYFDQENRYKEYLKLCDVPLDEISLLKVMP